MNGDGASLVSAVTVEPVYARSGGLPWFPFVVPKLLCDMIFSGEQSAALFAASLGLGDRN